MAGLEVKLEEWGPDQATLDAALQLTLQAPAVRAHLDGTRHRLLACDFVDAAAKEDTLAPPSRFRATIFDYTNNRTVEAEAAFADPAAVEVSVPDALPLPAFEEFEEAVAIASNDADLGEAVRDGRLVPYRAMPALVDAAERTVALGLMPRQPGGDVRHEIVGVNLVAEEIMRYDGGAPEGAAAHNPICGLPGVWQQTSTRGTPGQVQITIGVGGIALWSFLAIRPAASSGTMGSGIELRDVSYRGKRVLRQAHVPILNVQYTPSVCGPYRDWQWQEGFFTADGNDIAPGFRLCPMPAKTIIDSGVDQGNFRGVAISVVGDEVVLASELEAGWYRYISEWRFDADGTIRPRFGFSAVQNSCVCTTHHHHAYWRLDFDIATATNNRVGEFNDPMLEGTSNWHVHDEETKRNRDPARKRKWRIENVASGSGYEVVPGAEDGTADAFGRGDVWILRYNGGEIDDGQSKIWGNVQAGLDHFTTGESVDGGDVVLWYAGHFTHDVEAGHDHAHGHRVGPDLVPYNW